MNAAVIGTSRKENEKRVAIHPGQIGRIPKNVRRCLYFEKGYGKPFGVPDSCIAAMTGNEPRERRELLRRADAVILPKPVAKDLEECRKGTAVWGWIHSVQQSNVAQIAIERRLTLVAWENMYHKGERGKIHVFQRNNEMAGYCGVQHALELRGVDGNFGVPLSAVVLGFGSVSRGAVLALKNHGVINLTVLTKRPTHLVANRIPGVRYLRYVRKGRGGFAVEFPDGKTIPLIRFLSGADILVNGVLQIPDHPEIFIRSRDIEKFQKECLIIDVSCDEGMGFQFAKPSEFSHPFRKIGNILYYAVDHTPSLLWDSASWEISSALLPYLSDFIFQKHNPVLENAVDIRDGYVRNKAILDHQDRSPLYPYPRKEKSVSQENGLLGRGYAAFASQSSGN